MRIGDKDVCDRIFVSRLHPNPAFAATALVPVYG